MSLKIKGKNVPTTQIPLDNDWRDIQAKTKMSMLNMLNLLEVKMKKNELSCL